MWGHCRKIMETMLRVRQRNIGTANVARVLGVPMALAVLSEMCLKVFGCRQGAGWEERRRLLYWPVWLPLVGSIGRCFGI